MEEHFNLIATYCIAEIALLITLIKVINNSNIIPGAFSLVLSNSLGIGSFLYGLKIIVLPKEYGVFNLPHMKLINILILVSVAVIIIDDKYLIYVEQESYKRKSKVYCYYIETGEKKCIFKTNKEIVGVFVK